MKIRNPILRFIAGMGITLMIIMMYAAGSAGKIVNPLNSMKWIITLPTAESSPYVYVFYIAALLSWGIIFLILSAIFSGLFDPIKYPKNQ